MQITPISINNNKLTSISKAQHKPAFGSLLRQDFLMDCVLDSSFYRDNGALRAAINAVQKNFPQGADILDFACSNGEEALSILSQIKDKTKYKIRAFDVSIDALYLAKKGIHTVFAGWFDDFLLRRPSNLSPENKELRRAFFSIMERAEEPKIQINNSTSFLSHLVSTPYFRERYFRPKAEFNDCISYGFGNIKDLGDVETTKPVGAILFRNAFYHFEDNHIEDIILDLCSDKQPTTDLSCKIARRLVTSIDEKLEEGGVFVLGDHFKDNIFLANASTPKEKTIMFRDTVFGQIPLISRIKEFIRLRIDSPMVEALKASGKFEPIHSSDVEFLGWTQKYPTVWQKVGS